MTEDDRRKKAYLKWMRKQKYKFQFDEASIISGLKTVGINIDSLFSVKSPRTVRKYISLIVTKRNDCILKRFGEYSQAVLSLIAYADYLELPPQPNKKLERNDADKTRDSLIVAYYLSRKNKDALTELGFKTSKEAFNSLALVLDQKPSTIKNMRDEFDPYFDNGRVGWYQGALHGSRKEVFYGLEEYSDQELSEIVTLIIQEYKERQEANRPHRKKIHISSTNMKEINKGQR